MRNSQKQTTENKLSIDAHFYLFTFFFLRRPYHYFNQTLLLFCIRSFFRARTNRNQKWREREKKLLQNRLKHVLAARDLWFHNFKLKRTIFGEFFMCTFYSYRAWKSCVLIYLAAMCSNAVVCPERKKNPIFRIENQVRRFPNQLVPQNEHIAKKK